MGAFQSAIWQTTPPSPSSELHRACPPSLSRRFPGRGISLPPNPFFSAAIPNDPRNPTNYSNHAVPEGKPSRQEIEEALGTAKSLVLLVNCVLLSDPPGLPGPSSPNSEASCSFLRMVKNVAAAASSNHTMLSFALPTSSSSRRHRP
nr:unnamed protein product [Digitaria exilis]